MCRRTTCERCGKPSYSGCGAHIDQVLGDVPKAQRCRCGERAGTVRKEPPEQAQKSRFWRF